MSAAQVRLLLADIDGTLVTDEKVLTPRTVEAVHALREAGIIFAVTSGRPPKGMESLIEPLGLTTPLAAFNGGIIVDPDLTPIEQKVIPADVEQPIIAELESSGLDVWVYRGPDWLVRDPEGPHVVAEAHTVRFEPTIVDGYDDIADGIAKIVGVSDDYELVASTTAATHDEFGDHVSAARSQPYYLDITHPQANKGGVAQYLSRRYGIPEEQIATIGDMPNDVLMFGRSGLSIAMGQSHPQVQRAARRVTTSNEDEGFANAVDWFILRTTQPKTTATFQRTEK